MRLPLQANKRITSKLLERLWKAIQPIFGVNFIQDVPRVVFNNKESVMKLKVNMIITSKFLNWDKIFCYLGHYKNVVKNEGFGRCW
jgi:hypothetical protein